MIWGGNRARAGGMTSAWRTRAAGGLREMRLGNGAQQTETRGPSERERTTTRQPSSPATSPCSSQGCHFWLGFVFCHAHFVHRASTPFRRTPDAVRSRPHREWFTHYREVSQRRRQRHRHFLARVYFSSLLVSLRQPNSVISGESWVFG